MWVENGIDENKDNKEKREKKTELLGKNNINREDWTKEI